MNELSFLGEARAAGAPALGLQELSLELARTPCGPLYKTFTFPDVALVAAAGGPR